MGGVDVDRGDDGQAVGYVRSLVELFIELRARAGNPSYREIARRIPSSTGENTSAGYISEVLRGKRVPSGDMAVAIVQALRGDEAWQQRARRYAEVAGSDKAQSYVKSAWQQRAVPRQLPAAVACFAGRLGELATLTGLLQGQADTGGAVVIASVSGMAGIGKTALAVYWAHRVADRFPDGQLYVNLRGFDSSEQAMAPEEAMRRFLDALQVPPERIPVDPAALAALYRSQLAGKRMLVVLDNARDSAQVRPLLPGTPTCLVLVTSRNQLTSLVAADGAHPVILDLLTDKEAWQLLAWRLGANRVAAEPAVAEIIDCCARLPLALVLVATRAALRPQVGLHLLAEELRDARYRWDLLNGDSPTTDVRAVLSWSYQALTPAAARLFRLLGLYPGPDVTALAAASLAGMPPTAVKPLLDELTQARLLAEHTPGRFTFHDLLRAYARELTHTTDPDQHRNTATHRILDHYLHSAYAAARLLDLTMDPLILTTAQPGVIPEQFADNQQAMDWFIAERPVLLAAVGHAAATGFDTHTWQLTWALRTFLNRQGHWHDLAAAGYAAVAAAHRLADPSKQIYAHRLRALAYIRMDRLDDAHAHLNHALNLAIQTGDQTAPAHAHQVLARLWGERWDSYPRALDHALRALDQYRAVALNQVGWFYALLGDHQQALTYCQQAFALFQDLNDRAGQAYTCHSLGYAHHHLGHYSEALTCYQHALTVSRDLGDRYTEAFSFTHLGDAHHAIGNSDAARDSWQQALTILGDLRHPDADFVRTKLATLVTPATATSSVR